MKLSVVIPCFNEEESLPATLERVLGVVKPVCKDFEIILVDGFPRWLRCRIKL
jgi:glycosyltransferase involved in cell wall biosynthesis